MITKNLGHLALAAFLIISGLFGLGIGLPLILVKVNACIGIAAGVLLLLGK